MTQGATGAYQDGAGNGIFTSQNNVFRDNHYCVASATPPNDGYTFGWFGWMNGWLDFSTWQTYLAGSGGNVYGRRQLPPIIGACPANQG